MPLTGPTPSIREPTHNERKGARTATNGPKSAPRLIARPARSTVRLPKDPLAEVGAGCSAAAGPAHHRAGSVAGGRNPATRDSTAGTQHRERACARSARRRAGSFPTAAQFRIGLIGADRIIRVAVALVLATSASAALAQGSARIDQPPKVSGIPRVDEVLTATAGAWKPRDAKPSYQWLRCDPIGQPCSKIPGATDRSAYPITTADLEHRLRIRITIPGDEGGGPAVSAISEATQVVARPPSNVAPPQVSGAVRDGRVLSASRGTWSGTSPMSFRYRWQRCNGSICTTIPQAMSAQYALSAADVGRALLVLVTASNAADSATARSPRTSVVAPSPLVDLEPPAVVGTAAVGQLLSATPGRWQSTGPIDSVFRWLRCAADGSSCAPMPGTNDSRYRVRLTDVGSRIGVRVKAIADEGSATRDSALTAVVPRTRPELIQPFPRVHFKGLFTSSGAVIQLVTVVSPPGARIALSCRGPDCPFRRSAPRRRPRLRVHALERSLRAGTKVEIRVTQPTLIGKYTSILVRANQRPLRRDRCLMPGSERPAPCPPA
jgi:hypothetical protein